MSHHHHVHIDPKDGDKRVAIAIWANGLLTIAQVIGGIMSGSLALIADAVHNFSDMASLIIAFAARKIARRPADPKMTFGYGRVEVVAALINYTSLIIIGLYLAYEGVLRLFDPPAVAGWGLVILGGIALVIDTLTAALTYSMQKDSVNIRALFLHNLSDALSSVAVVLGGIFILLYDIAWVDPAVTLLIAVYILWLSFAEIGKPIRTLMLGSPPDVDTDEVIALIENIDGVERVHHAHFWEMQEHQAALDIHIVIKEGCWSDYDLIKHTIKTRIDKEFGISHSTIELEYSNAKHKSASLIDHQCYSGS